MYREGWPDSGSGRKRNRKVFASDRLTVQDFIMKDMLVTGTSTY